MFLCCLLDTRKQPQRAHMCDRRKFQLKQVPFNWNLSVARLFIFVSVFHSSAIRLKVAFPALPSESSKELFPYIHHVLLQKVVGIMLLKPVHAHTRKFQLKQIPFNWNLTVFWQFIFVSLISLSPDDRFCLHCHLNLRKNRSLAFTRMFRSGSWSR